MLPNILPFATASSGPTLYFAVIGCPEGGFLSPRVMQWNDDILLIDLTPTLRYWQQQATDRNMTLEELLLSLLPTMSSGVLASHPWQAVLNLKTFSARGNNRLIHLKSAFGRNLSKDLSWDSWWQTCHEIAAHWQACGRKSDSLVRNLRSMLQTMQRMQIGSPAQFQFTKNASQAHEENLSTTSLIPQMQRRFGVLVSTLWSWTWSEDLTTTAATITKDDFPWRFLKPKEIPTIQRLLENPLREWEHIESLLCEDLNRICNLKCWTASERVVSLEWVLSFSNSPALTIPVLFRHPHCLHREATHHKTALLQAFYSWQSTLQKRLKDSRFKADSQYLEHDSIFEWTLKVSERLIIPTHARSLFMDDLNSPSHRLRELENTLPCSLDRFDLLADWTPADSWTTQKNESPVTFQSSSLGSLEAQHLLRPLFIHDEPKPLQSKRSGGLIFKERVMRKWWELPCASLDNAMRDYYLRFEDDGVMQWIFQDSTGNFFLHGVYG